MYHYVYLTLLNQAKCSACFYITDKPILVFGAPLFQSRIPVALNGTSSFPKWNNNWHDNWLRTNNEINGKK